jgi:hypothetical protein
MYIYIHTHTHTHTYIHTCILLCASACAYIATKIFVIYYTHFYPKLICVCLHCNYKIIEVFVVTYPT